MKKKFLTFILSICFIIPCMFMFSACSTTTPADIEFKVENGYIRYYDGENWNNLIAVEDLKGEDADVWTIGTDGYWYKNGVKTNNKATGSVGAKGNGVKSITPSTDSAKTNETQTTYIITLDDNSTYEFVVKNGTDGTNGDQYTIGTDGFWYKNGVKTNNKAIGKDGDEYTIEADGYWYLNGEKTEYKAIGQDTTYASYTISYDYGKASTFFKTDKSFDIIKSTEWLTTLPEIKDENKDAFLGWFIQGTNKLIEKYDFIGGDIILEARFDATKSVISGLYLNGKYTKTWDEIVTEFPEAFGTEGVIGITQWNESYFTNLSGDLVIDDSITTISGKAFQNCEYLTSVKIPSSVISIGMYKQSGISLYASCFSGCTNLKNIVVDEKNAIYDSRNNCNAIIKKQNNSLLVGCKNTIIPLTVTEISNYAFQGVGLERIYIHKNITLINQQAYNNCGEVKGIEVDERNTIYDSRNNCNAIIEKKSNKLIKGCNTTVFPDDIKEIECHAFEYCKEIESINVPTGVVTIGYQAFYHCESLTFVHLPDTITILEGKCFAYCNNLKMFKVTKNISTIDGNILEGCTNLVTILVDGYNEKFNSNNNCNAIIETETNTLIVGCKNTLIPNNVEIIGEFAFYNMGIQEIIILDSVTQIQNYAFSDENIVVYYKGSDYEWIVRIKQSYFPSMTIYDYSEQTPSTEGNYWHYDTDGLTPIVW